MEIAPGNFKKPLPNVSIKGIKIFSSTSVDEEQPLTVEIKILVEAAANARLSPHKIFFACLTSKDRFESFKYSKVVFRNEIKKTESKPGLMKKFLGAGNQASAFPTRYIVNDAQTFTAMAKELVVTMPIKKTDFSGFLGCVAVPYVVEEDNINLNGLNLASTEPFMIGAPVMETILINNISPILGSVYVLKDTVEGYGRQGDYWTGAVHYHPIQGYMAGFRHGTGDHPHLEKQFVSNQKIKDLRFTEIANNLDASQLMSRSADINAQIIKVDNQPMKVKFGNAYFSNFHFSRGPDNSAKIYFALDEKRLFADYAKFAPLFMNKRSLFSTMQIEDIIIYRKRVKSADAAHKLTAGAPVDSHTLFYPPREYVGSFKDNVVTYLQLTNLSPNGAQDVFVNDAGLTDADAGIYEYTIEVVIIDDSPTALKLVVTKLENALTAFETYVSKFNAEGRKNFDPVTYIRMNSKEIKADDSWRELINAYMSAIRFIFGEKAFGSMSPLSWKKNLLAMANPMSADSSDVGTLRKLIFDFTSKLRSLISPPGVQGSEEAYSLQTSVDQTSAYRRKSKHSFIIPEKYERNSPQDLGVEYLSSQEVVISSGIPMISYSSYAARISLEVAKYKPSDVNAPGLNTYGFLSPFRVVTPTNTMGGPLPLKLSEGIDLLQAVLDNPTNPTSFLGNTKSPAIRSACVQNILGNSSVTVTPLQGTIKSAIINAKDQSTINMSINYLNEQLEFNTANDSAVAAASGSTEDLVEQKQRQRRLDRTLQSSTVMEIINQAANQFKKPTYTNTQPIEGSMAHQTMINTPSTVLHMNPFERNINFNSLVKVQYLAGYKKIPGLDGLKELNWQQLTKDIYDTARANNRTLLCECVEIGSVTNTQNIFKLDIYNKLFLLGDNIATSQPKAANFESQLKDVESFTKTQDSQVQLNTNTEAAAVPSQYIYSDNPSSAGMVNVPGKHGPHGGGMTGGGGY